MPAAVAHVWLRFRSRDYLVTLEYSRPMKLQDMIMNGVVGSMPSYAVCVPRRRLALNSAGREAELVRRSQDGDVDAVHHLVERDQQEAYTWCVRMLFDYPAVEDVTQESACRKPRSHRSGS